MKDSKHQFAIFHEELAALGDRPTETVRIESKDLFNRIVKILRLREGELVDLFDGSQRMTLRLEAQTFESKNSVTGFVEKHEKIKPCEPLITLYPALLKKDDFEHVCAIAAVLGAHSIRPVITEKSHRNYLTEKDLARLKKIMIAACEQSKNFYIPTLYPPKNFDIALKEIASKPSLYFDPSGNNFMEMLKKVAAQKPQQLCLAWGPEGDLTTQEKELLHARNVPFTRLTPMVLKSVDAITIALGALRSILS